MSFGKVVHAMRAIVEVLAVCALGADSGIADRRQLAPAVYGDMTAYLRCAGSSLGYPVCHRGMPPIRQGYRT